MVCIVCFDVLVIIRHDRYSRGVIKLFNYSVVILVISLAENYLKLFIWPSLWLKINQGIMI